MMRSVTIGVWIILGAALVWYQFTSLVSRNGFPTAGDLLSVVMRSTRWRWTILVGWMWLGWHFFVR